MTEHDGMSRPRRVILPWEQYDALITNNANLLEALIEIETAYVNGATAKQMVQMVTLAIRDAEESE